MRLRLHDRYENQRLFARRTTAIRNTQWYRNLTRPRSLPCYPVRHLRASVGTNKVEQANKWFLLCASARSVNPEPVPGRLQEWTSSVIKRMSPMQSFLFSVWEREKEPNRWPCCGLLGPCETHRCEGRNSSARDDPVRLTCPAPHLTDRASWWPRWSR
jgi:hypothetical protein